MKNLFLLLILAPSLCFGQKSICKKIKRSFDRDKGKRVVTYRSPELKYLSLIKQIKTSTVFALHLHFNDAHDHYETRGALVEFEDGTILKDENVNVDCKQEMSEVALSNNSASHSGEYMLQGFFPISDEYLDKFASKKIVRVQLHDVSQQIPEKEAMLARTYIKCMKEKQ